MSKKNFCWAFILFLAMAMSLQAQYAMLHSFSESTDDGVMPYGSLILKGSVLYGMTRWGGVPGIDARGAIFKINVDGTGFALLHSFTGNTTDGSEPYGSLILINSTLYGMTSTGGASYTGTIFKINVDGTGFALLHSFIGGTADGAQPYGSLILHNGKLYGMTCLGGASDLGTIFRISPSGTGFKLLHTFAGGTADGAHPNGTLKLVGTKLYGMTCEGGASDLGTIFRISPNGSGYKLLHAFIGGVSDGSYPCYGSFIASGSTLYGMTRNGGATDYGNGVIFKISTSGAGFAVLHTFSTDTTKGADPYGSLIWGGAKLYGMTTTGGEQSYGTIFKINPDGTGFELLHSFDYSGGDGGYPYGDLIRKVSAKYGEMLYGMANLGGTSDVGIIFSYKLK